MKGILFRIVGAVVLLAAFTYAGDYLAVRFKIPNGRAPFSTVTIQPYYAIQQKNGRTEYDYPRQKTRYVFVRCFPTSATAPCWYVKRHTDKQIDI